MSDVLSTIATDRNLFIISGVVVFILVVCLVLYFRTKESYDDGTIPPSPDQDANTGPPSYDSPPIPPPNEIPPSGDGSDMDTNG